MHIISLRVFVFQSHKIGSLVQGEYLQIFRGIWVGSCFQQKTCNISEMRLGRTIILPSSTFTNGKLHACLRLVPKSTTLGDLVRPLHTLFKIRVYFWAHHKSLNYCDIVARFSCYIHIMTGTSCVTLTVPIADMQNSFRRLLSLQISVGAKFVCHVSCWLMHSGRRHTIQFYHTIWHVRWR